MRKEGLPGEVLVPVYPLIKNNQCSRVPVENKNFPCSLKLVIMFLLSCSSVPVPYVDNLSCSCVPVPFVAMFPCSP